MSEMKYNKNKVYFDEKDFATIYCIHTLRYGMIINIFDVNMF